MANYEQQANEQFKDFATELETMAAVLYEFSKFCDEDNNKDMYVESYVVCEFISAAWSKLLALQENLEDDLFFSGKGGIA